MVEVRLHKKNGLKIFLGFKWIMKLFTQICLERSKVVMSGVIAWCFFFCAFVGL